MNLTSIVHEIREASQHGARFISFMYKAKGSGETAIYTLLLGVDLEEAYKKDLEMLKFIRVKTAAQEQARAEMVRSLQDSLRFGIGHNPAFTQEGLYLPLGKGIRLNGETGQLHIFGFKINKNVIQAGIHKKVKSNPVTLAKKALHRRMKSGRFRAFIIDPENIAGMKINGELLEFQNG